MFIDVFSNNSKDYLRLVSASRVLNKNGKKIPKKTVLLNIGALSKYDDGLPDYLNRLRQSFKAGDPLIVNHGFKDPRARLKVIQQSG